VPERRSTRRANAQLKVWCEGEAFTLLAETLNLSRRGLFVWTSSPPPVERHFNIVIEELGTEAEVELRWARPANAPGRTGLGLKIVRFLRGAEAFQRCVERHATRSGEHRVELAEPDAEG